MGQRLPASFNHPAHAGAARPWRRQLGKVLALALVGAPLVPAGVEAQTRQTTIGTKGAQIYCFMRNNGNTHTVSWDAAYAVIKRQGDGPFKTSPQHAAVLITEAVVDNPTEFPDCGRYLGDLFKQPEGSGEAPRASGGLTRNDRYGS
ncbi:MAG: DUF6554 family protein [Cyanobium sp.]|jgi:hypothetical protein